MQIRPLSPALRKKAEEEYKETPSLIKSSLRVLRDWLKHQPHLHSVKPTDQWLVAFLRGCKYDLEKCKGKIEMYYTLKESMPEFYGNRDPFEENIQDLLKLGAFLPLKKCIREDSPRICLSRVGSCSSSQHTLADVIKVSLMIIEIMLLEDDNFTISGEDVIADLDGLGLRLIWQWTPALARKITTCSEKALSVRLKSLHVIHAPFGINGVMAIFKMFLGAKIKNRIFAHSKDTLYDQIDRSILPEEYGGTDGTIQELIDYWKAKVESYREWFMDKTAKSDESKRPGSSKNTGFFGGWL